VDLDVGSYQRPEGVSPRTGRIKLACSSDNQSLDLSDQHLSRAMVFRVAARKPQPPRGHLLWLRRV